MVEVGSNGCADSIARAMQLDSLGAVADTEDLADLARAKPPYVSQVDHRALADWKPLDRGDNGGHGLPVADHLVDRTSQVCVAVPRNAAAAANPRAPRQGCLR